MIGAIAGPVGMAVGIAAGALVGAGAGEAFHETDEEDKVHEAELDEATGAGSSAPTSGAEGPKPKTDA